MTRRLCRKVVDCVDKIKRELFEEELQKRNALHSAAGVKKISRHNKE